MTQDMPSRGSAFRRTIALGAAGVLGLGAVAAGLVGTVGAGPAAADSGPRTDLTLTVLHTNDDESQLVGVDGDTDGDGTIEPDETRAYGGAARYTTLWQQLRRQAETGRPAQGGKRAVVSISGGDNYLAGPEFSASIEHGVPFYDALALSRLGLDASAIGNHEFDFGPDVFADFVASVRSTGGGSFPFVSANLDVSGEPALAKYADQGVIRATTVVRERGERIGVIGLTTPELPTISSPRNVRVRTELARIANDEASALTRQGVDKIILVSHLQDIDNELALVPQLRGVDVVLGAGGGEILADSGDRLIPGDRAERGYPLWATDADGRRVPVATTTGNYKYVGQLVLRFDRAGRLLGADDEQSRPVRVAGAGTDAVVKDAWTRTHVEAPVESHLASLRETVVADSEVPLNGVRSDVRSKETNLGDLVADALVWAGARKAAEYGVPAPVVGIQNGGGLRNDAVIPAGPVTALDTYDVAPFANFVAVVPEVPRDTLRRLLERGVAAAPSAAGAFIQVSGLAFTYDVSRKAQVVNESTGEILTPGERVRDVVLDDGTVLVRDGQVVDGAPVPVATNDFSARGGDAYPLKGLDFTPVGTTYQGALRGYLEEGLSGKVRAADYPVGGEGRITATN
ncbi:5'-nucleotidase [Actinopolymorpha cephalotaxi]|uniref:5'-nucleotidase n=1 Tax=Actinopolymorpha cephalotaxi TaxID=504797 RepID=A0A1I2XYZ5_9ACTN|nr:5'-nucleotidase C-terminal domain-containing protein [Actinopolymorpha cephalotaxi]NYH87202.1 5'-nucleotidase [Actinopolymorpha cephalotaxi]SFH17291.1 5'-nucleotidase [Actinopolymorpha cephalotaxi]